jgi:hypothetical protein
VPLNFFLKYLKFALLSLLDLLLKLANIAILHVFSMTDLIDPTLVFTGKLSALESISVVDEH